MIQFWYNIFSEVLKARRGKMKKRVILIVTIILIVFICLILTNTFRNYSIIMNLKEKASSYSQLTNYHIEAISSINNKTEDFQKDNMQCRFIYRTDDEISKSPGTHRRTQDVCDRQLGRHKTNFEE